MFFLINKPLGVSSNLVAKIMKRVLNKEKIGFSGTLDPLATGLMIIGTDGSPRLFPLMENRPKIYTASIRLDGTTASYDLEESVDILNIEKNIIYSLTEQYIKNIIEKNFLGKIMQVPPSHSATWIDGRRAYDLARKGQMPEIQAKPRMIHAFKILEYTWPLLVCEIIVSHGTYIRSLARDLGVKLGTGGYLEKLERTGFGHIDLATRREWIKHNDIFYSPLSHTELFPDIPLIDLGDSEKKHLRLGSTPLPSSMGDGEYFIRYDTENFGLLECKNGLLFPLKNCV